MFEEIEKTEKVEKVKIENSKVFKTADEVINLIEAWWDKHIKNSKVSRNTEIYNHLQGVKTVLTDSIKQGATENGKTV